MMSMDSICMLYGHGMRPMDMGYALWTWEMSSCGRRICAVWIFHMWIWNMWICKVSSRGKRICGYGRCLLVGEESVLCGYGRSFLVGEEKMGMEDVFLWKNIDVYEEVFLSLFLHYLLIFLLLFLFLFLCCCSKLFKVWSGLPQALFLSEQARFLKKNGFLKLRNTLLMKMLFFVQRKTTFEFLNYYSENLNRKYIGSFLCWKLIVLC